MSKQRCHKTGKVSHPDKVAACIAAKRMKNAALNVYPCSSCGGWHLGNSSTGWRRSDRIGALLERHERELKQRMEKMNCDAV